MRSGFVVPALCVLVAASTPAWAMNPPAVDTPIHIRDGKDIQAVVPGDMLHITAACVKRARRGDHIRVVFTLPDRSAGYGAVLATDQKRSGDALRVRVPRMPGDPDQPFSVKVFVLGQTHPEVCMADLVRVG